MSRLPRRKSIFLEVMETLLVDRLESRTESIADGLVDRLIYVPSVSRHYHGVGYPLMAMLNVIND